MKISIHNIIVMGEDYFGSPDHLLVLAMLAVLPGWSLCTTQWLSSHHSESSPWGTPSPPCRAGSLMSDRPSLLENISLIALFYVCIESLFHTQSWVVCWYHILLYYIIYYWHDKTTNDWLRPLPNTQQTQHGNLPMHCNEDSHLWTDSEQK